MWEMAYVWEIPNLQNGSCAVSNMCPHQTPRSLASVTFFCPQYVHFKCPLWPAWLPAFGPLGRSPEPAQPFPPSGSQLTRLSSPAHWHPPGPAVPVTASPCLPAGFWAGRARPCVGWFAEGPLCGFLSRPMSARLWAVWGPLALQASGAQCPRRVPRRGNAGTLPQSPAPHHGGHPAPRLLLPPALAEGSVASAQ